MLYLGKGLISSKSLILPKILTTKESLNKLPSLFTSAEVNKTCTGCDYITNTIYNLQSFAPLSPSGYNIQSIHRQYIESG